MSENGFGMQDLDAIEADARALLDKVGGRSREVLCAVLSDIEATRLELTANALGELGHTAEAAQARMNARMTAARAGRTMNEFAADYEKGKP